MIPCVDQPAPRWIRVLSDCRFVLVFLTAVLITDHARATEPDLESLNASVLGDAPEFVRENCLDCHDGPDAEGGFDAASMLQASFRADSHAMHRWIRVFDRVNDGEMPPRDAGDLEPESRERFLNETRQAIEVTLQADHRDRGRVIARRLTNDQLERTLGGLLAIDLPLARMIPEETRVDGFTNIAAAQSMSHYHLDDHLRVVDHALDFAWRKASNEIQHSVMELPAERIANKREGQRNRDPEMREGAAVIWSSSMAFYGRISNSRVKRSGWYEITLNASALNPPESGSVWCSLRSGECISRAPLMFWIDSIEVTEQPREFKFLTWIEDDHLLEIRPADNTLRKARFRNGQVGFGEGEPQKVPGIAMHSLRLERVFPGGTTAQVRERLFGDLKLKSSRKGIAFGRNTTAEDLKREVTRFAAAAFRTEPTAERIQPYLDWIDERFDGASQAPDLLKQVYRAILCSPRFMFFEEQAGRLSSHAIANRLSYCLTGRPPDELLRQAADAGELQSSEAIVAHARRLLDGPHFDSFINEFTDQWLDLADIDFTEPDRRMFREYDLVVQNAFLEETRRFITTLIQENRSARQLVDAEFTWLNGRLADYYGIDSELETSEWGKVSLADHPHRGGLLTHGSILKVTANGTNTSPVLRGVWVCDRLLGIPIPEPPANVPAIEPDIRGATTVRQILEKHRAQSECASCHARIDPPGFALEHFDAAGRYRDFYLTRANGKYKNAAKVDSAYQLADGREFDSFIEFRELAASDVENVARNFAAKLMVHATGREITFADRKVLDEIVEATREKQFGLRSLIEAVVVSDTFLTK